MEGLGLKPSAPPHDNASRKTVERDRAIIEHTADAFFVYDAGGRILYANRRACDTLG